MTTKIEQEKLAELESATIESGSHGSIFTGEACSMEWVAVLAGEGMTDAPECASPVIRRYVIALNDRWSDEKRQALKPFLVRMIGTGSDGLDPERERIAVQHVAGLVVPWLRLAGLDDDADRLAEASAPAEVRAILWTARTAACQKVRERLAGRPATAAVAVADAAADAAAVAAAVAAADGPTPYNAAYAAARAHYAAHLPPIAQEAAELAAEQDGAALDLLDRLIDPMGATA